MDITALTNEVWKLLEQFLRVAAHEGDEAASKQMGGEIWQVVRERFANQAETQKLIERVLNESDNLKVQAAFQYHLEEMVESDRAFAGLLQTLLDDIHKNIYRAGINGDGAIAEGEYSRAVGAQGVMVDQFRGNIHYNSGPVTYLNNIVPQPEKSANFSNLPKQIYFFGREAELKTVNDALSSEARTWGALIDGPGGIGKTALAVRAAELASQRQFSCKIFVTAKIRELTAEGERALTDFTRPSYLAMLEDVARALGEDGLERLPPDKRVSELRRMLDGKQALLIFDNLETLPEDERVRLFQFLERLPDGNKAIVTSRRRSDVDARIVRLERLSRDAALQLLDALSSRYVLLARTTSQERNDLYLFTQGNPLLMTWIAGQLGNPHSQCRTIADACTFIEHAPSGNDPLEYIFGDLLETFSEEETQILAALSHFETPARLRWLAELAKLPARAAETALEDLAERSVINTDPEAHTYLLPLLAARFLSARRPQAVQQTGDILENRAYALIMQYGANYEGFKILEAEWLLLAAALPRFLQGENGRLQDICNQLDQFLDFSGRWDDLFSLSQNAETRAIQANDQESAGWRAYRIGWAYSMRRQSAEVLAYATRAAEHWGNKQPRNKAAVLQLRGLGYKLRGDYAAAMDAYRKALEIFHSISAESEDVAMILNDLANIELQSGYYFAAEQHTREALRIAYKTNYQDGIAYLIGNLAELALDRKHWADAESLAREALALAEKIGRHELIAVDCLRLVYALLSQHQSWEEAAQHARRALTIFTFLQMLDKMREAQSILDKIEAKLKKK